MMAQNRNPDELGSLWEKTSSKGDYMTGVIDGVQVVCFRNTTGNPRAPQWRVLKSRPKPRDGEPAAPPNGGGIPF